MGERTGRPGDAGRGCRKPDRRSRPGRKRKPKLSTRRFAPREVTAKRRSAADVRAAELMPFLAGLRAGGIASVRKVAAALMKPGCPRPEAARGMRRWCRGC